MLLQEIRNHQPFLEVPLIYEVREDRLKHIPLIIKELLDRILISFDSRITRDDFENIYQRVVQIFSCSALMPTLFKYIDLNKPDIDNIFVNLCAIDVLLVDLGNKLNDFFILVQTHSF